MTDLDSQPELPEATVLPDLSKYAGRQRLHR